MKILISRKNVTNIAILTKKYTFCLQFNQVKLTEIIASNIELAHYTKPTPVQVKYTYLFFLYICSKKNIR